MSNFIYEIHATLTPEVYLPNWLIFNQFVDGLNFYDHNLVIEKGISNIDEAIYQIKKQRQHEERFRNSRVSTHSENRIYSDNKSFSSENKPSKEKFCRHHQRKGQDDSECYELIAGRIPIIRIFPIVHTITNMTIVVKIV